MEVSLMEGRKEDLNDKDLDAMDNSNNQYGQNNLIFEA